MNDDAELERGLGGRYLLERELGRGGTAVVWLARDLKHDRPVAFKLLHPALASSLGAERFQREIRFAARLQHPHVLTVLDSGETAGRLWFTMPFVEGETLRARLIREHRLPLAEALRIVREAAHALQYAHDHGVVHRDVKPENILLTKDGSTLVADFGIARALANVDGLTAPWLSTLTEVGLVVGTPAYMSPEQVIGARDLDGRSDVYALGCVLYEMLTGAQPFAGPTAQAVVVRHVSDPVPAVTAANRAVPPAISAAVARAMAKSPADRFDSPLSFAAALDAAAAPAAPVAIPSRRAVLVAAALLAALGTGFLIREATRGPAAASAAVASGLNRRMAQLTSREGIEEWPAWSPDGSRLAYSAEVNGYLQIVVRDVTSGEERQLTRGARDHIQPAWSADGRRLAFVRARPDQGKLSPSDVYGWYFEHGDIWLMDADGANAVQLVADGFGPAFSPDGVSLAFDAAWAGPRRLWVADVRGRNPRQVTSDSSDAVVHTRGRWSRDGRRLVYRRVENTRSDIALVDLASQTGRQLTTDADLDTDPEWSADGRFVYFASARGGGLNIWRLAPDEESSIGKPEQITTGAGDDIQPAVGPTGQVAFAVRGINSDIWRLPVSPETGAATGQPEPVAAGTRVESRGSWSPDGSMVAFNSDRLGDMNIWLRTLKSGTDRQITTGAGGDYQPKWSPDGGKLVFFSGREGNIDIWTVALADGRLTRLTTDRGMDINPFYSPDGSRIAFVSDRGGRAEVWLMDAADGSNQRQLAPLSAWGHFLYWTPDGSALVFRTDERTGIRIVRVSVADGTVTELPMREAGGHLSFSPSQAIAMDSPGHRLIRAYPMDGRRPYDVFAFENPDVRIDYPVWSPNGRWVLFDRAEPRGADLWTLSDK